jgi:hypothetical protein
LEYAIKRVQENQEGLKLNKTQQVLASADDIVEKSMDIIKKNTSLLHASKDVGLEVNSEKINYMLLSHSQTIGQEHSIKIMNR